MINRQYKLYLSIIIPTIDSINTLPRLIESIIDQIDESTHEIIFLDSESADGTLDYISRIPFKNIITHVIKRSDFSHSRTRMFGAEAASGKLVMFLSDDVIPLGVHFLSELCKPVAEGHAAASFGVSQICPETGDPLRAFRYNKWYYGRPDVVLPIPRDKWDSISPREKYYLCRFDNCAACYDRDILRSVGFPNVPYGEDIAVAKKLVLSGYPIALAKQAKFYHWHNVSYRYLLKRMCIDQILIRDLFGLSFVANMPKLVLVFFMQLCLYGVLGLAVPGIPATMRLHWIIYNIKFILADNLGKYMGCLKMQELHTWNILDQYLARKKQAFQDEVVRISIKRD
jgi:rhamnosyltransferase